MTRVRWPSARVAVRLIAVALVAVAGVRATQEIATDKEARQMSSAPQSTDRCRSLTSEQAEDPQCQRLWAEQRRRFLGQPAEVAP